MQYRYLQTSTLLALSTVLIACDIEVGNLNDPNLEDILAEPTRDRISVLATGLLNESRNQIANTNGYISHLGVLGRESYNLDIAADPRFVTEMLQGQLNAGSPAFGGNLWGVPYSSIWASELVLAAIESAELSEEEKEGVRGFAKTIQALDLLKVINTRDERGAVLEVNIEDLNDLGQIRCKDAVFAHIVELLEEAKTHLEAAGDEFMFPLSSGFDGFDVPETFILFNRALLARVQVYRGEFDAALVALDESFIDATADLDTGAFYIFSGNSGDTVNQLNSPNIVAHPRIRADAETNASGEIDARVTRKLFVMEEARTLTAFGIGSEDDFAMYTSVSDRVPIIRNEELILLRAEANIGLGTTESLEAATADINVIRVVSGELEELPDGTNADLDELLNQKRYSLLFEGGHRWIDLRRYGRLDSLLEEDEVTGFEINESFPIPENESIARNDNITCQE